MVTPAFHGKPSNSRALVPKVCSGRRVLCSFFDWSSSPLEFGSRMSTLRSWLRMWDVGPRMPVLSSRISGFRCWMSYPGSRTPDLETRDLEPRISSPRSSFSDLKISDPSSQTSDPGPPISLRRWQKEAQPSPQARRGQTPVIRAQKLNPLAILEAEGVKGLPRRVKSQCPAEPNAL